VETVIFVRGNEKVVDAVHGTTVAYERV